MSVGGKWGGGEGGEGGDLFSDGNGGVPSYSFSGRYIMTPCICGQTPRWGRDGLFSLFFLFFDAIYRTPLRFLRPFYLSDFIAPMMCVNLSSLLPPPLFLLLFPLFFARKRVGYNNMIYREDEIERIARVAGE